MNINDIFTLEQYDEAYEFVSTHEYTTIEDLGDGKYQIVELHKPTPEEEEQAEKERIAKLYLTGADVERGIYKAKGIDFEDLIALIEQLSKDVIDPQTGETIKGLDIDIKALKIELKANNFYRGNPYVNAVGDILGFTQKQLDNFFIYNDYRYLLKEEPVLKEIKE